MVISFLQRHPAVSSGGLKAEEHLGQMLHEILALYGAEFDFKRFGIAIENGGSYFDRLEYRRFLDHEWHSKRIAIRDPLFPSKNLSRKAYPIENIANVFRDAHQALQERLHQKDDSILEAIIHTKAS